MDQRSGNDSISGWSQIFAFYQRNSWTRLWSCSSRELLQHWTKSFRKLASRTKVSLEKQKAHKSDRFLPERQIAYLMYEYLWVTGANDSVENYADLFTSVLRNNDVQEFDSKWDGILVSMTKDSTWRHLGRIVQTKIARVWETQDLIGIVQYGDSSEEGWTWLPQMEEKLKRSVEQNLRIKKNLRPEMESLKQAPWSRIME